VGVVYFAGRIIGLVGGSWIGGTLGKAEMKIRKYLGMGILSQAGVAIGLALIVKQEFAMYGDPGLEIGSIVITAVTATSILFEILGPITTKIALRRAGEINEQSDEEARRR
jgi:Kef-type K+ transport system membrane component KefB